MRIAVILSMTAVLVAPILAAPTIDGVIGGGEWVGATKISIADGQGSVWVIAHPNYLYAAYDIIGDTKDGRSSPIDPFEKLGINIFGPTNSWIYADITFEVAANPGMLAPNAGAIDGYGSTLWSPDSILPQDLMTATLYDSGHRVTELMIPLGTIEDLKIGDALRIVGAVQFGSTPYRYPAESIADYARVQVLPVPSPTGIILAGIGTVLVGWLRHRRAL